MKGIYIFCLFVCAILLLAFGIVLQYAWKTPVMGYVMVSTGLDFSGSVLLVTAVAELIATILERPRKVKPYENAGDASWNDSDFIDRAHHIDTIRLAAELQGTARGVATAGLLTSDSLRLPEVLQGLPAAEAARRLQACGPNTVTDSSTLGATVVHVILDVLRRPQTRLLIVAAAVYAFVGVVDELAYLMAVPLLVVLLEGIFIPFMLRRRHRLVKEVMLKERQPMPATAMPGAGVSAAPSPRADGRPRSRRASSMVFVSLAAVSELIFSSEGGDHDKDGHGANGSGAEPTELLHNEGSYTVIRDGAKVTVQAAQIVPGDILVLKSDQEVPCDARLLVASSRHGITTVEAGLTGQHQPVNKRPVATLPTDCPLRSRASMLYRGSVITSGRCACLVVATGNATHIGRVHAHWHEHGRGQNESKERTRPIGEHASVSPVTEFLNHEAKKLPILVMGVAVVCIAIGMGLGQEWLATLSLALTVCFATIPEELPLLVTGILTVGASMVSRKGVLVRELHSLEAFALVDTIIIAHPPSETGHVPQPSIVTNDKGDKVQVLHTRHQTDSIALLSLKDAAAEDKDVSASLSTLTSRSMLMTIAGARTLRGGPAGSGRSLATFGRLMSTSAPSSTVGKSLAPKSPRSPAVPGGTTVEKGTIGQRSGYRAVPWLALAKSGGADAGDAAPSSAQNTVSSAPATQTKGSASTASDTLRSVLVTVNHALPQPAHAHADLQGTNQTPHAAGLGLPSSTEAVVERIPSWSPQPRGPGSGRAGLARQPSGLSRPGLPSIWAASGAAATARAEPAVGLSDTTAAVPSSVAAPAPLPPPVPVPVPVPSAASGQCPTAVAAESMEGPASAAHGDEETRQAPVCAGVDASVPVHQASSCTASNTAPGEGIVSSMDGRQEQAQGMEEPTEDKVVLHSESSEHAKVVVEVHVEGREADNGETMDAALTRDPGPPSASSPSEGITVEKPALESPGTGVAYDAMPSVTSLESVPLGSPDPLSLTVDTAREPDAQVEAETGAVTGAAQGGQHLDLEPAVLVRRLRAQGHVVLIVGSVLHDLEAMSAADVAVAHVSVGDTIGLGASILLQHTDVDTLMDIRTDAQALYASMQSSVCFYIAAKMGLILLLFIGTLWQGVPLAPTKLILLELVMDVGACSCYVSTAARAQSSEPAAKEMTAHTLTEAPQAATSTAPSDVLVQLGEPETREEARHISLLPSPQHGEHGPAFLPRHALWLVPAGALSLAGCILAGMAYALFDTSRMGAQKDLLGFQARAMALITWLMGHFTLAYNMRTFVRPVLTLPAPRSPVFLLWALGIVILAVALAVVPGAIQGSLLSGTSTSTYSGNTGYQSSYSTPINTPALSGVDVVVAVALAVAGTSWIEGAKWVKWALERGKEHGVTRQSSVRESQ